MKSKTDATKILLDAGWTYEEIESVLSSSSFPPLCKNCYLLNPNTFKVTYPSNIQYVGDNSGMFPYKHPDITSADIKYTKGGDI